MHMLRGMPSPLASLLILIVPLTACTDTNDIAVELAPEVISSIDGTLTARAIALADRDPSDKQSITLTVDYKDRNGTPHDVAPITGTTDEKGMLEATFTGLIWDGSGTLTATLDSNPKVITTASFAVLDRSPPKVTIMPPANNQVRINVDTTIAVHVTDEIGVSQVSFETSFSNNGGNNNRGRSSIVTSGLTDTTINFDFSAQNSQVGATVMVYALAGDLSGNQAAATPIMLTVVQ